MKTLSLMVLLATICVIAVADDVKPPVMPKKNKIVFEYSYPPPATQKPPTAAETAPPRTGSKEWLQRVDQRDRKLMAPWEWQRLSSWREAYSFAELPPSVNGFTSR